MLYYEKKFYKKIMFKIVFKFYKQINLNVAKKQILDFIYLVYFCILLVSY